MKIWNQNLIENIFSKQNFQKTKNLTLDFVYKMINIKYEVDLTIQLGYLEVKKKFDYFVTQFKHLNTFSIDFLHTAIQRKRISRNFRKFSKCVQLWWAVSPSSRNIFWWDRYHCKDLCLNFQTSLIRSKTGTWRQSYSRYKIQNFRKNRFHTPKITSNVLKKDQWQS